MKRISLLFVLSALLVSGYSQEEVSKYEMSYFAKSYVVSATEPKSNGEFSYYIDANSMDRSVEMVSLKIESKQLEGFKELVNHAKAKYLEWSQTAKDNNVEELDKDIELKSDAFTGAFYYGSSWKFDLSVSLKFRFKIVNGKYLLIIENSYKMVSSSNKYMTCDGFAIVLNSSTEIDDFLASLDKNKVIEFYNKKSSKEDLFKN